jgi:PAS domain-containing protein
MPSPIRITDSNEEICRELIDNSLSGLAIIRDKTLVYTNNGLADIIGLTLEEMLALSSDDFISVIYPDDQNLIRGALIDGISGKKLPRCDRSSALMPRSRCLSRG